MKINGEAMMPGFYYIQTGRPPIGPFLSQQKAWENYKGHYSNTYALTRQQIDRVAFFEVTL